MGKKMDKFKTGTETTVKTAKTVAKVAATVVAVGGAILEAMDKNKK